MKILITIVVFVLTFGTQGAAAETFFQDCNLKGLDKITDENKRTRVFWNRFTDAGKGNAGESVDILVDLETGDVIVTCVSTADEDTAGQLSVQIGGVVIPIGPVAFGEVDPGVDPVGP